MTQSTADYRSTATLFLSVAVVFRRHRKAIAALEFGLTAPFLVIALAGAANIGFAQWAQICLTNALAQGAYYAFLNGSGVTTANVKAVVTNATPLSGMTNVTVTAPACYCPTGTPVTLPATSVLCTSTCSGNITVPAYYLKITATYSFTSFLPSSFAASTTQHVVVRLQ